MKITSILFLILPLFSDAQLEIKGVYKDRNMYVQNRTYPTSTMDCIDSIVINNSIYAYDILYRNFEIKLDSIGLKESDEFELKIYLKSGCDFRILNPESFESYNHVDAKMIYDDKLKRLEFTASIGYEIYDTYGSLVLEGTAKDADLSNLLKGSYTVLFGKKSEQINLK